MSWLFGIIGKKVHHKNIGRYETVHGDSLYRKVSDGDYYFACGGHRNTCHFREYNEPNSFWIGLGTLIRRELDHCKLNRRGDWEDLARERTVSKDRNGHFVLMSRTQSGVVIRTDPLGLRTIYWSHRNNEIIISTRLDWICSYIGGGEIDYGNLGSRWLLFNQLSYDSLVNNIHRLGPGGELRIDNNSFRYSITPFTPKQFNNTATQQQAVEILHSFASPLPDEGESISLGLSGGLDSRTLLSLMIGNNVPSFRTHTFGSILDPDVWIPQSITTSEHLSHSIFDYAEKETTDVISTLESYAAETNLVEPVSTGLRLHNIARLQPDTTILMDGGFGEVARRQYLNRLGYHGERPFREQNIALVRQNLSYVRGSFFSQEIRRKMEEGVNNEIASIIRSMPNIKEIGIKNYLDLWAVRTRFPNFGSDEQARLDTQIVNFMPFAQLDFVDLVFRLPLSCRNNGTMFRNIIKAHHPTLAQFPLVKNGTTYPFRLSTVSSYLHTKIKSVLGYRYSENHIDHFLLKMESYINDLMLSRQVRENSTYSYRYIRTMVETYYQGDNTRRQELLWWVTYELWRRAIERT